MECKEFLKPNWKKILLTIILGLLIYSFVPLPAASIDGEMGWGAYISPSKHFHPNTLATILLVGLIILSYVIVSWIFKKKEKRK